MSAPAPAWRIALELPDASCVEAFDEAISLDGTVVTAREIDGGPRWSLTGHCAGEPDRDALEARVAVAAASVAIDPPPLAVEALPPTDWVAAYRLRTRPVTIGGFFIYPSHYEAAVPEGLIGIGLDAGIAFGTGEHQSTAGCLLALERLRDGGFVPRRALDMGCGSAILAIAMARLWPAAAIVAVDNDPDAVRTAAENVAGNDCAGTVVVAESDGYDSAAVRDGGPYDLIAANILARPLAAMAGDAAAAFAPDGRIILSGILSEQAAAVRQAYEKAGLAPSDRVELDGWTTLVMTPHTGSV